MDVTKGLETSALWTTPHRLRPKPVVENAPVEVRANRRVRLSRRACLCTTRRILRPVKRDPQISYSRRAWRTATRRQRTKIRREKNNENKRRRSKTRGFLKPVTSRTRGAFPLRRENRPPDVYPPKKKRHNENVRGTRNVINRREDKI